MKPRVEVDFNAEDRRAFRKRKPEYRPQANEFLLNHARSGLLLALQSLNLPKGSKVGVMVYNCHTVMNAVAQVGGEVVFIDVDDSLRIDQNDLEKKSIGLKVLIVTHLFGILNDIKTIRDLVTLSEVDLKDLKGFGQKALDEVKEKLTELNI